MSASSAEPVAECGRKQGVAEALALTGALPGYASVKGNVQVGNFLIRSSTGGHQHHGALSSPIEHLRVFLVQDEVQHEVLRDLDAANSRLGDA